MAEDPIRQESAAGETSAAPVPEGDSRNDRVLTGEKSPEEISNSPKDAPEEHEYPGPWSLAAIMIALYFATFLVALDRTIIATAIPRITDDFHALGDIAWYGSAYLLTSCSFQLLYGRIYTFYKPKWVFLVAVIIFEIGSAVCGAAPTSTAFIVGRALAGLGACGIFSGCVVIITDAVPLQKRPMMTGFLGSIFGIASVVAPVLGGAFTDNVSWRWCFYINLPIGAVSILVILFVMKASPPPHPSPAHTARDRLNQLDPLGTVTFLPAMVCLILALTWGGTVYAWKNARIIALFILSGVLFIAFVLIQMWKQETASVPPRLAKKRTIAAGFYFSFCVGSSMMIFVYYLPIWFQAIKGASAVKSGIMNIPLVLSLVVGSIFAGVAVSRLGYFTPFMLAGSVIMSIGAGLISTFTTTTGHRGAVFLAVAQTVFGNSLSSHLRANVPGPNGADVAAAVINAGATGFRKVVPAEDLPLILPAYNKALMDTFYAGVALACASIIGGLATEWVSVKKPEQKKEPLHSFSFSLLFQSIYGGEIFNRR